MIKAICICCEKELEQPGGLAFIPTPLHINRLIKEHICVDCFEICINCLRLANDLEESVKCEPDVHHNVFITSPPAGDSNLVVYQFMHLDVYANSINRRRKALGF